jgi:hypothetical protein
VEGSGSQGSLYEGVAEERKEGQGGVGRPIRGTCRSSAVYLYLSKRVRGKV